MKGQWLGRYSGTNSGQIVVDLDKLDGRFEGWAYLFDDKPDFPAAACFLSTSTLDAVQNLRVEVLAIDNKSADLKKWAQVSQDYPNIIFPKEAQVKIWIDSNQLKLDWSTDIGGAGHAELPRSEASSPSRLKSNKMDDWGQFKEFVTALPARKYIFRGQERAETWRLRTHFHRAGRANLRRFIVNDIPELYRCTVHVSPYKFNLNDSDELGAFYALVQHHGFPTPLLDWTMTPYVAAYFAFAGVEKGKRHDSEFVRVFMFDAEQWQRDCRQWAILTAVRPHFSTFDPVALGNARMIQQQGTYTLSNIDDLESYILQCEDVAKNPI